MIKVTSASMIMICDDCQKQTGAMTDGMPSSSTVRSFVQWAKRSHGWHQILRTRGNSTDLCDECWQRRLGE